MVGDLVGAHLRGWVVPVAAILLAVITTLPGAGLEAPVAVSSSLSSAAAPPGSASALPTVAASPISIAPAYSPAAGVSLLGPLPPSSEMSVGVGLASRDPQGLVAWIAAAHAPGTPEHGTHLSAAAAAERFGAAPVQVRAAETYFRSYGLAVSANPDGLLVDVNGPSAQVGAAFRTSFDLYRLPDGRTVVDHPTAASLPAVAAWTGALGLGNLTPIQPLVAAPPSIARSPSHPSASCTAFGGALLPCAIQTAYNITPLLNNGTNGTGVRVAVVDAYSGVETADTLASDFRTFAFDAGLPTGSTEFLYPVPSTGNLNASSTNPGWGTEDALDFEWSRAVAPGDTVEMTFSPNPGIGLYEAVDWLVAHQAADVISLSWGEPDVGAFNSYETPCTFACNASTDGSYAILGPVLELAAAQGITVFAASGDCGAADGTAGVSTGFPASDPYVTGVGGTELNLTAAYHWLSESAWSGNESGAFSPGCQNSGGSGGGYSPFPRPYWQVGTGLTAHPSQRGVPDVAMDADPSTGLSVVYNGFQEEVGGTSVGSPIWAGIGAVADQAAGTDLGLLNPSLYSILDGPGYGTDFHDVQTGNNGYHAGVGWDPVTGIGTPKVASLVPALVRGGGLPGGNLLVEVNATPPRGAAPLTVDFYVSIEGGSGIYPLIGISFGDGNASLTTIGVVAHTFATAGVYSAQAFVFDSGGNESVSAPTVVVVGGGSLLSVTLSASIPQPSVGESIDLTTTVVGGTAPYAYNYTFGDGSFEENSTSAVVPHAYELAGTFCAAVVVRDAADPPDGGLSASLAIPVGGGTPTNCTIAPAPFTLSPITDLPVRDAPADYPALFNASGGSTGSGRPAPTLTLTSNDSYATACDCALFPDSGSYWVNATGVDSVGDRATANTTVTVAPALAAQFSSTALAGPVPLTVNFSVAVSGGYHASPANTVWSSGIGTTDSGATAQFTYSTPGEFLATGAVSDDGFGNASEAFLVYAEPVGGAPPLGLTGTIAPARNVSSGTTVVLSATAVGNGSSDPSNALVWSLGSGRTAFGPLVNETFLASPTLAGDTLDAGIAVQGSGQTTRYEVPLNLTEFFATEASGFVPSVDALTLTSASVSPSVGPTPLPVTARASAAGPGGATLTWLFGDGGTRTGASESYTYTTVGRYSAEATATDPYGDTAVLSSGVDVTAPITVLGAPAPVRGTAPLTVSFAVKVTGGVGAPFDYAWTFGDGSTSTVENASHVYSSPGTYSVTLNVTDAAGEVGRAGWNVTVETAWGYPTVILIVGLVAGTVIAVVAVFLWDRRSRRKFTP